jgi:hypothetical protein
LHHGSIRSHSPPATRRLRRGANPRGHGHRYRSKHTLAGLGHGLNGTHTVYAINPYSFEGVDDEGDLIFDYDIYIGNQVIFYNAGDDLERSAAIPSGTLDWSQTCTWIVAADVLAWLGISVATANDTAFVGSCTDAANAFAFRRRKEAGYFDSLTTVPGADVKLELHNAGGFPI